MDANYYCDAMYSELTALRSRLYGIMRKSMEMSDEDKEKMSSQLTDMNMLADDLTKKVDLLKRECPTDWNPMREDIEKTRMRLEEQINYWDEEHIPAGYKGG